MTGCASVPPQSPRDMAVAVHPPLTIERPWLMPRPTDEITLFDTRTLQALRQRDDTEALNAVQRPGMWVAIGFGAVWGLALAVETVEAADDLADDVFGCLIGFLFGACDDDD
jgi:hypothetical protein